MKNDKKRNLSKRTDDMDPKQEKSVVSEFLKIVFATTSLPVKKKIVIEKNKENEEARNSKVMKNIEKVTCNYSWNLGMCGYCYESG